MTYELSESDISQSEDDEIAEALRFLTDVVGGKFNAAKKDNDFIYHEKVPELESLPEIQGEMRGKNFN